MINARMLRVGHAQDRGSLGLAVRLPDLGHLERRQHHPFGVAQAQPATGCELGGDVI